MSVGYSEYSLLVEDYDGYTDDEIANLRSFVDGCRQTDTHGYRYFELDRCESVLNGAFWPVDGSGPISSLIDIHDRQGYATVLDAGCGTGRQLYELIDYVRFTRNLDPMSIYGDGVSDFDFSMLSEEWRVRAAFMNGDLHYEVGDLQTLELPEQAYDLVYSYEVLVHNEKPGLIVENLWRALRAGGVLYFNAAGEQADEIRDVTNAITACGGIVLQKSCEPPHLESMWAGMHGLPLQTRDAYAIRRPIL